MAADLPPGLVEAVCEEVFDWAGENGEGGGRLFWDQATRLVLEVLADRAEIIPRDQP